MQINFTGHGMEISPALKHFAEEKLNKLERHFDKITAIHVVFNVEKLNHIAEATILVAKGELHASSDAEDMYSAVDLLIDKLDRQLLKHKEKKLDHRNHRDHMDIKLDNDHEIEQE